MDYPYALRVHALLAHCGVRWDMGMHARAHHPTAAALYARTLTEQLRPYAATYMPAVDCAAGKSVTLTAVRAARIELPAAVAALLAALDPHCPLPPRGFDDHIFHRRAFHAFFSDLAALAELLDAMSPPTQDQDPWGAPHLFMRK